MSNLHASTLLPRSHPSLHTSLPSHTPPHVTLTSLPSPRVLLRSHPSAAPGRRDTLSPSLTLRRGDALAFHSVRSSPRSAHSRSSLRSHFICIASRPAVRAAVVMRPAHASADRGRRRSRRRDQVRTRFASAVEQRCFQPWRLSVSWLVATPPRRGASALTAHQHAAGARRHAAITIASQHDRVSLTPQ